MPQSVSINITLTINPPAAPQLVVSPDTVTLPDETVGVAVDSVPVAMVSGGTPPYTQPVVAPDSPAPIPEGLGLSIDSSGNITMSGTPSVVGSGTFKVMVSDSGA